MTSFRTRTLLQGILLAGLPLAASLAYADAVTKAVTPAEAAYQAGGSPLAAEEMHQNLNPKAPPMTKAEFTRARQIYFERCAGCHGVLRKGATGKPLTPDITLGKGTDYLKIFIAYGSPAGMPNWQTSGEMSEQDVDLWRATSSRSRRHRPSFRWPTSRSRARFTCR